MLFRRELKEYLKSFLITVLICGGLIIYIIALTPTMGADMQKMLDLKFPKQLQQAFGMEHLNFRSSMGIFAIAFSYIYLTLAIFCATILAGIMAKEFNGKTAEYLFTLPVSRLRILTIKISVAVLYLLLATLVCYICAVAGFKSFIKEEVDLYPLLLMSIAWFAGSFAMGCIAYILSAWFTKSAIAVSLVLLFYLLQVVLSLNQSPEWLNYFSPFDWYKGNDLVNSNSISGAYTVVAILISALCIVAGSRKFIKKEVLV